MKILVCSTEYPPYGSGIANVVYNVVEELKKKGVECTICSPTGPDIHLGSKELIKKFGIPGLLYYWYQVSRFFNNKNDYDGVWLQNPLFVMHNPFERCLVTMYSTYYGMSSYGVGNPLLHCYMMMGSRIEQYCLTRLSKNAIFSGVSQPVCEELEKIGIKKERITYIPNGVNVEYFRMSNNKEKVRNKFGIPNNDIVLLSVGRLSTVKQPEILIKIFSILENKLKNITLCVVGKGELMDFLHNLVKQMGLRKIKFLGYVDDKELPDLYACADYYIITSKYEGLPLTLLEAMASGLPCIVSDIPQLGIVKEANCGIIVDFNNIEKAEEKIMNYLKGNHSEHAFNARDYAVKRLDWDVIAERYLDEFEILLKN